MRRENVKYKEARDLVSNMTKAEVDDYAEEVAKILQFKPADDLAPKIHALGGRLHYESPFGDWEDEGTIFVHGPNDFDIILSSLSSKRRDRFTIAHELGHYLLHSKLGKTPLVATRKGTGRCEWEANWFAAGLLMPAKAFREKAAKFSSTSTIADAFLVSVAAVEVRKKSLGLS